MYHWTIEAGTNSSDSAWKIKVGFVIFPERPTKLGIFATAAGSAVSRGVAARAPIMPATAELPLSANE